MSKLHRRDFLRFCSAGACAGVASKFVQPLGGMVAYAQSAPSSRVMVVVSLDGGCSYNITPPYNSTYRDRNPNVSYGPENSLPLTGDQGLHPSLAGIRPLYDEGALAVINMVGYPNENRSHAESADIWRSGLRNMGTSVQGGWAARMTCQSPSMFAGVSFAGSNLLIEGDCNPPRAIGDLNSLGENDFWSAGTRPEWIRISRARVMGANPVPATGALAKVSGAMSRVEAAAETLREQTEINLPVNFPNTGFGRACADAARIIAARQLGTQFIMLSMGGFDTHSNERPNLTNLLNQLNGGLTALVACCKALGRWGDVMILTMSEFCRTHENGSEGTDHGHAGPMLAMGGLVKGGLKTPSPTDAESASGAYFRGYHVDFREVFGAAVRSLGYNSASVFPEGYAVQGLDLFW